MYVFVFLLHMILTSPSAFIVYLNRYLLITYRFTILYVYHLFLKVLFRNKMFMFDKMFHWNISIFAIFLEYDNQYKYFVCFFIFYQVLNLLFLKTTSDCRKEFTIFLNYRDSSPNAVSANAEFDLTRFWIPDRKIRVTRVLAPK